VPDSCERCPAGLWRGGMLLVFAARHASTHRTCFGVPPKAEGFGRTIMSRFLARSLSASVLSALVLTSAAASARAAASDYRFEVVRPAEAASGDVSRGGSTVTVALIHARSGQRITNAEVFRRQTLLREKGPVRIDERRIPLVPDGQGNYRLTTYYPLTAGSTLKLGARVPGESGTVTSDVRLAAPK
jgi:hypothetical protein